MSDIFISYKREDEATARTLAASLEAAGWSVWWDPQLRTGERFDEVIEQQLGVAKCVIVLWSLRSIQSQYVKDEAIYALSHRKLLPVTIDEVSLPFRFQSLHTLSLTGWRGSRDTPEYLKLLADIGKIVGAPSSRHQAPQRTSAGERQQTRPAPGATSSTEQARAGGEQNAKESILGVTAVYGQAFTATQARDIYKLRVFVNLLGAAGDADVRAKKESGDFLARQGYDLYEIVDRRRNFLRGYYEYTIRFSKS